MVGESPLQGILEELVFLAPLDGLGDIPSHWYIWLLLFETSLWPLGNAHRPPVDIRGGFESHGSKGRSLSGLSSSLKADLPFSSAWLP